MTDRRPPIPPPPPLGRGAFWGFMIVGAIGLAAMIAIVGMAWWSGSSLYSAFKNDPTQATVMQTVNHDATARAVLGDKIVIESYEGFSLTKFAKGGLSEDFTARIRGSKAQGTLSVRVERKPGDRNDTIVTLMLTGPDGHQYDLTHPTPPAPPDSAPTQGNPK